MSPSAAVLAPLRTVRRSSAAGRNQSVPETSVPLASPREAQSAGPQCEGGLAVARGLTIAFVIVCPTVPPRSGQSRVAVTGLERVAHRKLPREAWDSPAHRRRPCETTIRRHPLAGSSLEQCGAAR